MIKEKPEDYPRKYIESHHIQTLCQIIMWSCLITFLGKVSIAYFSLLLAIIEQSPYFLPGRSLIGIGIAPWLVPGCYHYIATDQFLNIYEENRSHIQRQNVFH